MSHTPLTTELRSSYKRFADHIASLSPEDYRYTPEGRWSAAMQLHHIVLCVKPVLIVFSMDAATLKEKFGISGRASQTPEALFAGYAEKLGGGGKAPERFVPPAEETLSREQLISELSGMISSLITRIEAYGEQDLDTFCIPHPLLAALTFREMIYNMIHHVDHHKASVEKQLSVKV
jgi:hypothetical protein